MRLGLISLLPTLAFADTATKPNVLFLAVDDMRPELNCYGCEYMHTPTLNALAKESLVFDSMYVQIAVCAPSRTVFLTSRRPDTSRVYAISAEQYWRRSGGNFTTLPQHFKENGYLTLGTGKIFHPGGPSNNSDCQFSWEPESCDPYINTYDNPGGSGIYDGNAVAPWNVTDDDLMGEGQLAQHAASLFDAIAKKRAGGDTRPFFLAVGFHRPHIPWNAPQKYYDLYDPALPLAPNQNLPIGMPYLASNNAWHGYWARQFPDIAKIPVSSEFPHDNTTCPLWEQKRIRQAYRAAISFTDRNFGVVLAKLDSSGWKDSTIISFISDHGYQLGDNGQWAKMTNFEHATRVPSMLRLPKKFFPSFAPGRTTALLEEIDLFPTLVDAAFGAPPQRCPEGQLDTRQTLLCTEGASFLPLLTGNAKASDWKTAAFSQYARSAPNDQHHYMGYTIRVEGWRYTEWVVYEYGQNKTDYTGPAGGHWLVNSSELYAHESGAELCNWDYEHTNLAEDPAHSATRDNLSKRLHAGWRGELPPSHTNA